MQDTYNQFIIGKNRSSKSTGFEPRPVTVPAFDWQEHVIKWAVRTGKAALFEDCGLGKTLMQLVWCQNVVEKTNGNVLLLTPLAVGAQTLAEASKFGISAARSRDGAVGGLSFSAPDLGSFCV